MKQKNPINYVTPPLKHPMNPSYSSKAIPKLGLKTRKLSDYLNPSNLDKEAYNHDLKTYDQDIPLAKYSSTDLISRKSTGLSLNDYEKTRSKLKDVRADLISEHVEKQQTFKDKLKQM
jgi:hypothetical protein